MALGAAPLALALAGDPAAPRAAVSAKEKCVARAERGTLVARLEADGHRPRAERRWPIRITARTRTGRPVQAVVRYQYFVDGELVACRSRFAFYGRFQDDIVWPRSAVGISLTFRAVVTSAGSRRNLDYRVRVRR
jgi:hypothetical protein